MSCVTYRDYLHPCWRVDVLNHLPVVNFNLSIIRNFVPVPWNILDKLNKINAIRCPGKCKGRNTLHYLACWQWSRASHTLHAQTYHYVHMSNCSLSFEFSRVHYKLNLSAMKYWPLTLPLSGFSPEVGLQFWKYFWCRFNFTNHPIVHKLSQIDKCSHASTAL